MSCLNGLKIITQEDWTFVVAWITMRDMQGIVLHMNIIAMQYVPLGVVNACLDTINEETVSVICIGGVVLR